MSKICAGIVTYNPNINLLKQNLNSIINQVECVFIVDNASSNFDDIENIAAENNRIIITTNVENMGIAKALNQLCENALEKGFDWILTLDQDSISPANLVEMLARHINDYTAIIAPNIIYKNNESFSDAETNGIQTVEWVITSASLTNLKVWRLLDGFDEILFIDGVDRDYGIRATRAGYKIIKCYDVKLLHELGNLRCKKKFGRTIYVTNHSALRKYYMVRNAIYLDKKLELNMSKKYIVKLIIKTVLYEVDKIKKLEFVIKGIKDAKKM